MTIIAERLSVRQIILHRISQRVCIYVSRLGMCALRANVRITCVCVTHRNVACWTQQAGVYLLHAAPLECNSQSDAATTTTSDRRVHNTRRTSPPQLSPATTVSRVGISVYTYTSVDVFTCIALRQHLREAFTAYTYP